MKFAWKLHASQQSFNLLGSPCGDKPLLMYPDFLQIFTALSFLYPPGGSKAITNGEGAPNVTQKPERNYANSPETKKMNRITLI